MKQLGEECTCSKTTDYFKFKKLLFQVLMNNKLGLRITNEQLNGLKYSQINKYCVRNKLNLQREMRHLETIVNYARGPSVMVVMGINHIERMKDMLEIYEQLNEEGRENYKEEILNKMNHLTVCK